MNYELQFTTRAHSANGMERSGINYELGITNYKLVINPVRINQALVLPGFPPP